MIGEREAKPLVGIINTDDDLISLMKMVIEEQGFRTKTEKLTRLREDPSGYLEFLRKYDPQVLVIIVPNPVHCPFIQQQILDPEESQDRGIVLASAWPEDVNRQFISKKPLQYVGLPFEYDDLVRIVTKSYELHKGIIPPKSSP